MQEVDNRFVSLAYSSMQEVKWIIHCKWFWCPISCPYQGS